MANLFGQLMKCESHLLIALESSDLGCFECELLTRTMTMLMTAISPLAVGP